NTRASPGPVPSRRVHRRSARAGPIGGDRRPSWAWRAAARPGAGALAQPRPLAPSFFLHRPETGLDFPPRPIAGRARAPAIATARGPSVSLNATAAAPAAHGEGSARPLYVRPLQLLYAASGIRDLCDHGFTTSSLMRSTWSALRSSRVVTLPE